MKRVILAVVMAAALAASSAWGISVDPAISYNTTTGTTQNYTAVAIPFYVNSPITVVSLGAFDYDANGLSTGTTIEVGIYSWTPAGSSPNPGSPSGTPVVSATLNNTSPSVPGTGSVWSYVSPYTLSQGWYMIYASGFNSSDPVILTGGDYSTNTFGGAVSYGYPIVFGSTPLYGIYTLSGNSSAWVWNSTVPIHISGGTFGVPEPSTYALMGTVGLALYLLRRRKKAAER